VTFVLFPVLYTLH